MAKRKDSKNRVLKKGEGVRKRNSKESYYYRWSDDAGKRHYIYSDNLNDLRRQENQIVRDKMDNIKYAGNLKLNDIYHMWVKVRRGLKEITFSGYQYIYENYVYATLGQKKITNLTKMDLKLFYIKLAEENNLNISTIENIHNVIHQVIDFAVEQDYLRKNISTGALKELKRTEECSGKKVALTTEQQKLFEECLLEKRNIYYRTIFLVMLYAGLRAGEATGLRWCDIDFDKKEISVNHTLVRYYNMNNPRRYTYAINKPKTKNSYRKVPMASVVYDSLKQLKQFQEDIHLTCKQTIDGYYDFIFINQFGTIQEKGVLNKVLNRIVKECNMSQIEKIESDDEDVVMLPHISCHILRHTAATRLFESGASARFVMDILGHADIRTTMNIYVDVMEKHKTEEFSRYQAYMESLKC